MRASLFPKRTTGEVVGLVDGPVPTPQEVRGGPFSWDKAWLRCMNTLKQNLQSEIVGCVNHNHVDPRPEWEIAVTEGLASTGNVIINNTIRSTGFNVSVTAGGAVGTVGVICGMGVVVSYAPLVAGVAATWAVSALRRERSHAVDVTLSVLNDDVRIGDLKAAGGKEEAGGEDQAAVDSEDNPAESTRERREFEVRRRKPFFGPQPRNHGRIPVMAGEVANLLKLRHIGLRDTPENRFLIRADAGKRAEALRREGERPWNTVRNAELLSIAMHASEMYWILSRDEEYVGELYSESLLRGLRRRRNRWVSSSVSSK
ncbi:hypothetical protein 1 [Beihai tombus-like virus 3]|uniref:hypothetical protein 1 n=1 Tax=Beihai tombus-like virus 3 TaxID=1922724 RepID=UPI00090B22D1|nr:hypothetical protein 1 [Beihai tombus-like virus 3]APG76187.1 hypothetical protein 1 [Beihai tombus-like virus 3]